MLQRINLSDHSWALQKDTSNTNQDLLTLSALLVYFHDTCIKAKQFHDAVLKNDTYTPLFELMPQTNNFIDVTKGI